MYVRQNIWNYCFPIFVTSDFCNQCKSEYDGSIYGHINKLDYMLYF